MKAVYKNTVEEIANFNLYTFTRSPHFKRNILNGRMFVLVYVILIIIYSCLKLEITDRIIIIGFFVIFGIQWFFLFPRFYTKSIKGEVYSKHKHGRLHIDEITAELDGKSINVTYIADDKTQSNAVLINDDISAIVYTDEAIYVIAANESQSLVIPYSTFESDTDKKEFTDLLNVTFPQKITQTRDAS